MENVREKVNLETIPHTEIDQIIKRQSKLSFKGISQHYNDFSLYKYDKEKTVFDNPLYLAFSVLELSKLLLLSFIITNYNYIITIKVNCIIWIQIL